MQYVTANDEIITSDKIPVKKGGRNPILETADGYKHLVVGEIVNGKLRTYLKFKHWMLRSGEAEPVTDGSRRTNFTIRVTNERTKLKRIFSDPSAVARYFGASNSSVNNAIKKRKANKKGPLKGLRLEYEVKHG